MDYGYHENIRLPEDAPIDKEASWEDIAVVANPYAVAYNRPDLSAYNLGKGTPLDPKSAEWDRVYSSLTPSQKVSILRVYIY